MSARRLGVVPLESTFGKGNSSRHAPELRDVKILDVRFEDDSFTQQFNALCEPARAKGKSLILLHFFHF